MELTWRKLEPQSVPVEQTKRQQKAHPELSPDWTGAGTGRCSRAGTFVSTLVFMTYLGVDQQKKQNW